MIYKENILSRQLYDANMHNIIKNNNPFLLIEKTKRDYLDCFFWYVKTKLIKIIKGDIVDEEQCLTLDEMLNTNCNVEIDLKELPRVAVYTCILGKYDILKEPLFKNSNCDFYAITDFTLDNDSTWLKIKHSKYLRHIENNDDNTYINRWFKMHPHILFPDYDYSLYIDGSVRVVSDIMPLVLKMIKENTFLGMHRHYARRCLKSEAKAIIKFKKNVNIDLLKTQISEYRRMGYVDDNPLLEATIILRKHNDKKCIKIMNDWWDEFLKYIPRDQMSLPYVLWKNGVSIDDITLLGRNEYMNPRFIIMNHN